MMQRCTLRLLFVSLVLGVPASAQEPAEPLEARTSIAPLPILFYTPETKTALGAALTVFHRPAGSGEEARPSTLTPILIYTLENQVVAGVSGDHYWDEGANNARAGVSYLNFPDSFYGIGNDVSSDTDEDYTTESYSLEAGYLRQIRPGLRVGGLATFAHSTMLVNEFRVDVSSKQGTEFLLKQAEEFFFGEGGDLPPDFKPQESDAGDEEA